MNRPQVQLAGVFNRGFVLCVSMLALSGCAARYTAPRASAGNTASLEAVVPVWIAAIDGKRVSQFGLTGEKQFVVSAGAHVIDVRYVQYSRRREVVRGYPCEVVRKSRGDNILPVSFVAEAGHNYYVKAGFQGNYWRPLVTEIRDPVFQEVGPR